MKRRIFKLLRYLILGLLLIPIVGLVYQAGAATLDRQRMPPPGTLRDVNGKKMHIYCKGNGDPTVILEAGLGGSWIDWSRVHDDIAQSTRTCTFDRFGNGWSDRADSPQSSAQIAATLHDALGTMAITPPYLLVGHSAGGLHVRSFASAYADEVMGMVLVDSGHEAQIARWPKWVLQEREETYAQLELCRNTAPFGLVRLLGIGNGFTELLKTDEALSAQFVAMFNRTQYCGASLDEQLAFAADTSELREPESLGDLPLVVLARGIGEAEELSAEPLPPNLSMSDLENLDTLWREMQIELSELSSNSQLIIAEESRHFIQADQPELVIDAVQSILEQSR